MEDIVETNEPEEDEEPLPIEFPVLQAGASDKEIEDFFRKGRIRVAREENKLFLTHVVDFVRQRKWGELRPEYQRRLRWSEEKKSRLIESFLMNVPVPPVFLYEKALGSFEVMDGQQRLNAILEFFEGSLALEGLLVWPALNGKTFAEMPPLVRTGLERATLSAITLTPEEDEKNPYGSALRTQVFDRLNTGGEKLNPQELRNALYGGLFNQATIDLAGLKHFTDAWDIPPHDAHTLSDGSPDDVLKGNRLYKKMEDVEIVLRFFAFKDDSKITGSVRKMLDDTSKDGMKLSKGDIESLKTEFVTTLKTAHAVFGDELFRRAPTGKKKKGAPSKPLYDAVMVSLYKLRDKWPDILKKSQSIRAQTKQMTDPRAKTYLTLIGKANTATSIKERIQLIEKTILEKI